MKSANSSTGWVSISRGIFEHEFFAREPFSEREAWVWMVAKAAWQDTRHRVGNDMVDVPRGSFFCTLRELQSAWMWRSDTRVRNFLKRTQAERMVKVKNNAKKTHVTICNYDNYQSSERKENAKKTQAPIENKRKENALKKQVNNKQPTKENKSSKQKTRMTQMPEGAVISESQIQIASEDGHGLVEAEAQFALFKNGALANARKYANWDAAWSNWFKSPYFKIQTGGQHNGKQYHNTSQPTTMGPDPALEQLARLSKLR